MTLTEAQAQNLPGRTVVSSDGDKAGHVGQLFTADATGAPEWVTVKHGLFGARENFAPLAGAAVSPDGDLSLAVTLSQVRDAPGIDNDGHLDATEVSALYAHYGIPEPAVLAPPAVPGAPAGTFAQQGPTLRRYVVTEETRQVGKQPL
jgi:hypothetical protein